MGKLEGENKEMLRPMRDGMEGNDGDGRSGEREEAVRRLLGAPLGNVWLSLIFFWRLDSEPELHARALLARCSRCLGDARAMRTSRLHSGNYHQGKKRRQSFGTGFHMGLKA